MNETRRKRINVLAEQGLTGIGIRRVVRTLEQIDAEHNAKMREAMEEYWEKYRHTAEDFYRLQYDFRQEHGQKLADAMYDALYDALARGG